MRRLLPDPDGETLQSLYRALVFPAAPSDRPYVYLGMVASADGAASLGGRTGGLGGEADRRALFGLREWCDAVLVGAATARLENYGSSGLTRSAQERRRQRNLTPVPRLVVVTASAALGPSRLFTDSEWQPLVVTVEDAPADRVAALSDVAEVLQLGHGQVPLGRALACLRADGVGRLLCEGGPRLNAQLVAAGLVDELFVTITPQLVGDSPHRILDGRLEAPVDLALRELREHDGELLARYVLAG